MIRAEELGRPDLKMADITKRFVESAGYRSRRNERQG